MGTAGVDTPFDGLACFVNTTVPVTPYLVFVVTVYVPMTYIFSFAFI